MVTSEVFFLSPKMNDTDNFSVCSVFYQMLCFCCLFIDVSLCNDKSLVFNVSIDEVFIINLAVVYRPT